MPDITSPQNWNKNKSKKKKLINLRTYGLSSLSLASTSVDMIIILNCYTVGFTTNCSAKKYLLSTQQDSKQWPPEQQAGVL